MILEPDFLDHWKTRLFIDMMGDEMASNYILRLWFHCQFRRKTVFEGMTGQVLKAVCRYAGDGDKLLETMLRVGFIEVDGDTVSVPKWAEANEKMMANWDNGKKGGRPRKTAENKPKCKPQKPNDNPLETHSKPEEKKEKKEKRGEEREEREEREEENYPPRAESPFEKPPQQPAAINAIARFPDPVQEAARDALNHWHHWSHGGLPNIHSESTVKDLNRLAAAEESQPGTLINRIKTFVAKPPPGWPRDAPLFKVLKHLGYDAPMITPASKPQPPRQVLKDYTAERLAREKVH